MSDRNSSSEERSSDSYSNDVERDSASNGSRSYDSGSPRSDSRERSRSSSARRGSKYRSRSRSRERSRRRSRYSRSRSRSYERRYGGSRKRATSDSGDQPKPNRCLGVFGLSIYTSERVIREIFQKYGKLDKVQVIYDAKSGRSRGFCFVYYDSEEDAKMAKDQCSGMEIDGRRIRVDFSITQRAHTPTPGIYMGNPSYRDRDRGGRGRRYYDDDYDYRGGGGYRDRRSPSYHRGGSPYRRNYRSSRYERSRSRSYSRSRY